MRHLLGEPYHVTYADPSGVLLAGQSESGVAGAIEMSPYRTTIDWQESALVCFEHGYVKLELPAPLACNRPGRVEIFRDPGGAHARDGHPATAVGPRHAPAGHELRRRHPRRSARRPARPPRPWKTCASPATTSASSSVRSTRCSTLAHRRQCARCVTSALRTQYTKESFAYVNPFPQTPHRPRTLRIRRRLRRERRRQAGDRLRRVLV